MALIIWKTTVTQMVGEALERAGRANTPPRVSQLLRRRVRDIKGCRADIARNTFCLYDFLEEGDTESQRRRYVIATVDIRMAIRQACVVVKWAQGANRVKRFERQWATRIVPVLAKFRDVGAEDTMSREAIGVAFARAAKVSVRKVEFV